MFEIHLGIPEMERLWNDLQKKHHDGTATKKEVKLRRQMGKAIFTILDHHNGDSYSIVSENVEGKDSKVLKFFCGLFEDIIKKITK